MAVLVDALPTSPANLLLNPWAHADGDNTTPSHVHWTDESAGGNLISVSQKVTEPTPYAELDGAELATAFRLADTIGEDGGGQADIGGATATLTQVVAANSALLRLHFFMHYVSNNIETFQVIISGSDSAEGTWTELWRPYSETFKETSMAWAQMDASPVHEKTIATGYDFLQVKFEVRFADAASQGMKWTGVYLAQSAAEDPAGYEAITVGTSTNSKASGRTSVSFEHVNDGDAVLVCFQSLSTTTSAPTVTSPAYGGVALTQITAAASLNGYLSNRFLYTRWFYLTGAAAGANNLTATLANAAHDSITVISLSDIDAAVAGRTDIYNTGNTANSDTRAKIRLNTTRPKSLVVSACHIITANSGPFAPDGSMTELYDSAQGSGTNGICFVVQQKTIATSDTLDAGTASTTGRQFSISGLEILAAAIAGGTTFEQGVAGALTSAGGILRQTGKAVGGQVTSAGTMARLTSKALAGALTSAGAVFKRATKDLAGALTSSGVLQSVRTVLVSLAGALTSAGTLTRHTGKGLAGVLASAGVLTKQTSKGLTGALTSSGAVTSIRTILVTLAGSLSSSGSLVRQTGKGLAGSLTSAGTVIKQIRRSLAGVLSTLGTLATSLTAGGEKVGKAYARETVYATSSRLVVYPVQLRQATYTAHARETGL